MYFSPDVDMCDLDWLALEVEHRHSPCSSNPAALQYAGPARGLVTLAEKFSRVADAEDIMFALIATDNLILLDEDVRATVLRPPTTATAIAA